MEPAAVQWVLGGENAARVLKLSVGTEQPIQVLGVRTSDDRLFATLKAVELGRSYEVTVTADSTALALRGVLRVETDYPPGRGKVYNVPVEISAPFLPPTAGGQQPAGGGFFAVPAGSPPPSGAFPSPAPQNVPQVLQPLGGQSVPPIQVPPMGRRPATSAAPPTAGADDTLGVPTIPATGARTFNPAQQFPGARPAPVAPAGGAAPR